MCSVVASGDPLGTLPMQDATDESMNRARLSTQAPGAVLLSDEIVEFIESGVSIVIGVVGSDGRAQTGRALAVRMGPDGAIRLIYPMEGNATVAAAAQSGNPIAVTFSAPLSHRTVQIKGFTCKAEELDPEDLISAECQSDAFAAILGAIGYPAYFVQAFRDFRSAPLGVLSFPAQAAFEQTPGPGAGRSI
jgi:hypothetical protein